VAFLNFFGFSSLPTWDKAKLAKQLLGMRMLRMDRWRIQERITSNPVSMDKAGQSNGVNADFPAP
jgi:hypothetical protein